MISIFNVRTLVKGEHLLAFLEKYVCVLALVNRLPRTYSRKRQFSCHCSRISRAKITTSNSSPKMSITSSNHSSEVRFLLRNQIIQVIFSFDIVAFTENWLKKMNSNLRSCPVICELSNIYLKLRRYLLKNLLHVFEEAINKSHSSFWVSKTVLINDLSISLIVLEALRKENRWIKFFKVYFLHFRRIKALAVHLQTSSTKQEFRISKHQSIV